LLQFVSSDLKPTNYRVISLTRQRGIVLAHNHPSGDSRPSESDCRATRRLASAVEALDCAILDHLVFAGPECASLRKLGLL
jgi:DNA repair protein RadC